MNWLGKNKLTAVLILLLAYFIARNYLPIYRPMYSNLSSQESSSSPGMMADYAPASSKISLLPQNRSYAPVEQENRLVVEESSLSLVVNKVRETVDQVIDKAKETGGFMVSSSLSRPEEGAFATVVIRVPEEKFRETIDALRGLAVKVVSENILGTDVTDEYVDIASRLFTLEKTKAKFESIMDQASKIDEILQVQREIISLQDQIDALKGREKYLEQTAKLAKITVYLSADELALPYAPSEPFRPQVIFKMAVRSLVRNVRSLATSLIWLIVYSVIWIPVLLIYFFIKRKKRQ